MKTVSIIIPVYNAEKTIRKCIESIIKQSSENWEVIAIDDGSSDESYAILQEYAKSYPDKIYALTQKGNEEYKVLTEHISCLSIMMIILNRIM